MSESFEAILGHVFQHPKLLAEALTHRSAAQGKGRPRVSNERLEFIGDRVLGLVMAEWLAERFPNEQEGICTATAGTVGYRLEAPDRDRDVAE